MTLILLLYLVVCIGVGLGLGIAVGIDYGVVYGVIAFPLGAALGCLVLQCPLLLDHLWHIWRPLRPMCKRGKCKSRDYRLVKMSEDEYVFQCSCGDTYSRRGPDFLEVLPSGASRPYMRRSGFLGKWVKCISSASLIQMAS